MIAGIISERPVLAAGLFCVWLMVVTSSGEASIPRTYEEGFK